MRAVVLTCDPYLWALRPFAYFFNVYWSSLQQVVVGCYTRPNFQLPENFTVFQMAPADPGPDRWSDGVIKLLTEMQDDLFVLMLEDYWLSRTADTEGIVSLAEWMDQNPDVLRMDLTTDRLYNGKMQDTAEHWGHYDLISTPYDSPYQMSFQAGIWRRDLLLALLQPGRSPWQVEIHTQPPPSMAVYGTRQYPLRYANILKDGDPTTLHNMDRLEPRHVERVREWLPR